VIATAWSASQGLPTACHARPIAGRALQHGRPVVLTDQVMANEWARTLAERPGVFVVRGMSELADVVDDILRRLPTDDLESFPDLAAL
jgi:DNA processing protein